MKVEVDHLETLWPPYRGHVLLRVAGESHGRVINSKIAVVAGHAALSLEVRKRPKYRHQGNETTTNDGTGSSTTAPWLSPFPTCLRLTVLLDAIPDDGPKPNSHQMEKFLMRVLGSSELSHVEGRPPASKHRGLLGEDIPEILVVENTAKVRSSSSVTCYLCISLLYIRCQELLALGWLEYEGGHSLPARWRSMKNVSRLPWKPSRQNLRQRLRLTCLLPKLLFVPWAINALLCIPLLRVAGMAGMAQTAGHLE